MIVINIDKVFNVFGALVQALSCATTTYWLVQNFQVYSLTLGQPPESNVNQAYFGMYCAFMMCVASYAFLVLEIGIFFAPKTFKRFASTILRGVCYIIKGAGMLSIAGDLGISAGSFEIICGVIYFILNIINICIASKTRRK